MYWNNDSGILHKHFTGFPSEKSFFSLVKIRRDSSSPVVSETWLEQQVRTTTMGHSP